MPIPVAVHIGYPKTATTWLQTQLVPRHPQLWAFVEKSPHGSPFLTEIIARSDRDFSVCRAREAYEARLADLNPAPSGTVIVSAERLSGSAASGGYDSFRIAQRLHQALPEARVFFTAREQVEMIESQYRQLLLEGSTSRLTTLVRNKPSWDEPRFDLAHYEYDRLADEYARLFGPEQIKVFSFADVVASPNEFLDQISDYLGIERWDPLPDAVIRTRVNQGASARLLGLRRFLNHFRHSNLNPDPILKLPEAWRPVLAALAVRLPGQAPQLLDASTRAWIQDRFAESNALLETRYGAKLR